MESVGPKQVKGAMTKAFEEMWEDLYEWRAEHPEASNDEIAAQLTPKRRTLMGEMISQLAIQHGDGEEVRGVSCPDCGELMSYKGKGKRAIAHLEGESELKRAYYLTSVMRAGKEVKTVSVSAVERVIQAETDEPEVRLTQHSYRAGLWEAKDFANQQWAERYQRGLQRANHIVSINDDAL